MSRKYNTKHPARGISNYPERLARRGLNKAPSMMSPRDLKNRQGAKPSTEIESSYAGWDLEQATEPPEIVAARNLAIQRRRPRKLNVRAAVGLSSRLRQARGSMK